MMEMPSLPYDTNIADLAIVIIVGLYVLDDARRGFVRGLIDLVCLVAGLVSGLLFYASVAPLLVERFGVGYALAKPVAFALIWILVQLTTGIMLGRLIIGSDDDRGVSAVSRVFGLMTGVVRGLFFVTLSLGVLRTLPLPDVYERVIADSRFGPQLLERAAAVEDALRPIVGDAVQETLTVLTVRPASTDRVGLPFTVSGPRIDASAEDRMLGLVNRERAAAGLEALRVDETLREVARKYSVEMFQVGQFSHVDRDGRTPFDRLRQGGATFSSAGENLALAPTVDVAHQGLMNSPGHRANILESRFRRVGIGVADGAQHGKMFTQNFAD